MVYALSGNIIGGMACSLPMNSSDMLEKRNNTMSSTNNNDINESGWISIGEHESPAVLNKTLQRIRAKWLDRYELRICPKSSDDESFQLQLKHTEKSSPALARNPASLS